MNCPRYGVVPCDRAGPAGSHEGSARSLSQTNRLVGLLPEMAVLRSAPASALSDVGPHRASRGAARATCSLAVRPIDPARRLVAPDIHGVAAPQNKPSGWFCKPEAAMPPCFTTLRPAPPARIPTRRQMNPLFKSSHLLNAALCVVLAGCAGVQPARYSSIESSPYLRSDPQDKSGRVPYRYALPADWHTYRKRSSTRWPSTAAPTISSVTCPRTRRRSPRTWATRSRRS